jgi:hypothetical protein
MIGGSPAGSIGGSGAPAGSGVAVLRRGQGQRHSAGSGGSGAPAGSGAVVLWRPRERLGDGDVERAAAAASSGGGTGCAAAAAASFQATAMIGASVSLHRGRASFSAKCCD